MLASQLQNTIIHHLQAVLGDDLQGIMLYGSQATGQSTPESDIDLAVLSDGPVDPALLWNTAQELACQVMKDVDLVDFRAATTVLQKEIVEHGVWLQKAKPFICDLFETHVISMYQQLQEDRKEIIDDVLERVRNG